MSLTRRYLGAAMPDSWNNAPTFPPLTEPDRERLCQTEAALHRGRVWPLRDQGYTPTCTAYAAIACLELMTSTDNTLPPHLSAGFMYHHMREEVENSSATFPGKALGFTRFRDAVSVLQTIGYVDVSVWPEQDTTRPPQHVTIGATKYPNVSFKAYRLGDPRPTGLADLVAKELLDKRPVGAAFPEYHRPGVKGTTNWTDAFEHGFVTMPRPGDVLDVIGGHAVCIVGYTKHDREVVNSVNDGYFIFRYSAGENFASAPTTGEPQGYGLLPASLLDHSCWELMFMTAAT